MCYANTFVAALDRSSERRDGIKERRRDIGNDVISELYIPAGAYKVGIFMSYTGDTNNVYDTLSEQFLEANFVFIGVA